VTPEELRRGLDRHASLDDRFDPAIRIVDYDSNWAAKAEVELRRIKKALGPLAVRLEHVGSTAVPAWPRSPSSTSRFLSLPSSRANATLSRWSASATSSCPKEAARYAALKREAAGRHPQDRLAYIAAKDRYVSELEGRAVEWARTGFR
jgi:GrpB-like predicted nucleotidyltransferase (UPF0157 family)